MKVSVVIVTYNHEKYIAQALDSVLMQKVNFDYEVVVGEDCSTDSTRKILFNYQRRFPDKVRLLLQEKNKGPRINFTETWKMCRGDYIATLDGDDYWTSPTKLQRQVDLLEAHPNYSMCFHPAKDLYEDGLTLSPPSRWRRKRYTLKDLLTGMVIPSCSPLVRGGLFDQYPNRWYKNRDVPGDWVRHVLVAMHGDIGFIEEAMAVHRAHRDSEWSQIDGIKRLMLIIKNFRLFDTECHYKYKDIISRGISSTYIMIALVHIRQRDRIQAREYLYKGIATAPVSIITQYRNIIAIIVWRYFPYLAPSFISIRNKFMLHN